MRTELDYVNAELRKADEIPDQYDTSSLLNSGEIDKKNKRPARMLPLQLLRSIIVF